MKIGFLGNINNSPFALARALRALGHEVHFIVYNREALHRPECRFDDVPYPYPDWIHEFRFSPFFPATFLVPSHSRRQVIQLLRSCDAVVLNDVGPSLWSYVRRPAIVFLTGSDLQILANWKTIDDQRNNTRRWPRPLWGLLKAQLYRKLIGAQRLGIRSAVAINFPATGFIPNGDAVLREIGVVDDQRMFFLMAKLQPNFPIPMPNNEPVRVFCPTRLNWQFPIPPGYAEIDYKGSDVMIRGLGLFWRQTSIPLQIRLIKKGLHVAETMVLVDQEGLTEQVTWLEPMSQLQVQQEYERADIVFDQFGLSMVGMAGLDAMATGRPVIAHGRPEILEPIVGEPSPLCQATTPEEVCIQLQQLVFDPEKRARVGVASHAYVKKHFSPERAAEICLERLKPYVSGVTNGQEMHKPAENCMTSAK